MRICSRCVRGVIAAKNGKLHGVQFFPLVDVKTLCESICERHSWGNTLRKRFAECCLETLCQGTFDGHGSALARLCKTWLRTLAGRILVAPLRQLDLGRQQEGKGTLEMAHGRHATWTKAESMRTPTTIAPRRKAAPPIVNFIGSYEGVILETSCQCQKTTRKFWRKPRLPDCGECW